MNTRQPTAEALISGRNILLGGRTNEHVLPSLQQVLAEVDSVAVSSTRKIIARCVAEAIAEIKGANFIGAGWILNLIHNLPLDDVSEQRWDVDYFLSMELPTFLDHFEEIKSARLVVLYVCKELANQHLPDCS
ncbi:hypothetical protein EDE08_109187 [Bradyrhizobium sp. R2.2-H]|jgi:hypothetical protein|uniref:hypothetical protein n=1 Tax=unclassified Bradyrhizobium TaxID=2631580 RepID=UPI0010472538|nr:MULTISPECIES: hypothetical protein [unclassified Bradyrhizobium]TCU68409.1 hypothetical protein EDE10_109226 [Bradyrhizobium sp. Y-H1]TCU69969.1 hypothetical protein EDE08_109187 [Bradyrhizobium sp. R2.2-H]